VLGVADVGASFPHCGTYHPARQLRSEVPFPAAERALADGQLRRDLRHATRTIREKRAHAVAELADGPQLRVVRAALGCLNVCTGIRARHA
jgi:hypothetical protein